MLVVDKKLSIHLALFAGLLVSLGLAHEAVNLQLRYDREAIQAGQLWRLVTCHLVHLNVWHMAMNLTGFLLCWFFFADLMTRRMLWTWLGVSAPGVGLAFFFLDPGLERYVGLSGLLHGLLILLLITGWRGNPVLHSVVLAVIVARMLWEQQPAYDVDYLREWIDGRVYVNAHLYGGITGFCLSPFFVWGRGGYRDEQAD